MILCNGIPDCIICRKTAPLLFNGSSPVQNEETTRKVCLDFLAWSTETMQNRVWEVFVGIHCQEIWLSIAFMKKQWLACFASQWDMCIKTSFLCVLIWKHSFVIKPSFTNGDNLIVLMYCMQSSLRDTFWAERRYMVGMYSDGTLKFMRRWIVLYAQVDVEFQVLYEQT